MTTPDSGQRDEHAVFLHMLGKATGNAHALEVTVGTVLAVVLGVPLVPGRLVAARIGLSATLDLLRELATTDECAAHRENLRGWLPEAKAAVAARNRVIHSPWYFTDDGPTGTLDLRRQRFSERTLDDLSADVVLMLTAIQAAETRGLLPTQ